mmetsp:Transcript_54803/g.102685  ORF Transcript_54803/g.102685 Transcript_54803/m.102685 type:complete len:202 (-) Transcript_54803:337-942(-)
MPKKSASEAAHASGRTTISSYGEISTRQCRASRASFATRVLASISAAPFQFVRTKSSKPPLLALVAAAFVDADDVLCGAVGGAAAAAAASLPRAPPPAFFSWGAAFFPSAWSKLVDSKNRSTSVSSGSRTASTARQQHPFTAPAPPCMPPCPLSDRFSESEWTMRLNKGKATLTAAAAAASNKWRRCCCCCWGRQQGRRRW